LPGTAADTLLSVEHLTLTRHAKQQADRDQQRRQQQQRYRRDKDIEEALHHILASRYLPVSLWSKPGNVSSKRSTSSHFVQTLFARVRSTSARKRSSFSQSNTRSLRITPIASNR